MITHGLHKETCQLFPGSFLSVPEQKHKRKHNEGSLWGDSPFNHLQKSEFLGNLANNDTILTAAQELTSSFKNKECLLVSISCFHSPNKTRSSQKPDAVVQRVQVRYFMEKVTLGKDLKREEVGMRG